MRARVKRWEELEGRFRCCEGARRHVEEKGYAGMELKLSSQTWSCSWCLARHQDVPFGLVVEGALMGSFVNMTALDVEEGS